MLLQDSSRGHLLLFLAVDRVELNVTGRSEYFVYFYRIKVGDLQDQRGVGGDGSRESTRRERCVS